jgi:hypothetical protein
MVYRGDPDRRRSPDAQHLDDPPPGNRPDTMPPPKNWQARALQSKVFVRVLAATLILLAIATVVLVVLAIATH